MPRHPYPASAVATIKGSVYSNLAHRLETFNGERFPLHVGDTWMEPADGCRMQDLLVTEYPGMHRYTSPHGMPLLLDAVVERTRARTGVATERDDVLIAAGATGALGAVAGAILDPGDEVLILAPYWPLIEGIVRAVRAVPVAVPFLDVEDAASAVEAVRRAFTAKTAALYLSTPNNPSGRLIPRSTVQALVEWAAGHGLWILSDEVYEDYVYEGEHTPARPLAPERVFAVHSFSKAYGMAGNRCGYVVGPREVMGELRKIATHTFYATPTASQIAAARALSGLGSAWVHNARSKYAEIGRRTAERLRLPVPQGSTFLFLDVADHLDARGITGFLERAVEQGVLLAPGSSFGPYPTHLRLCFTAIPPEATARGVEILAGLLGY
ncbi:MAG: pyridoxal phosphate-dependent aminotransferase [Acidobacteriota bacterium]